MHIRNINTIFMLLAGIIVAVYSLISNYSLQRTAYTLIIVLVIFFVIGSILQGVLNKALEHAEVKEQDAMKRELDEAVKNLEEDADEDH